MSSVVRVGDTVRRTATPASATLQKYLAHLRRQGLGWVPEPLGFDEEGREVLSFIEGQAVDGVPPEWFWQESLLREAALRLRQLHDASAAFNQSRAVWNWDPADPPEVILHRDFAPYNCIFRHGRLAGLVDFDLCAPGPRLWDIAYTAYRFVPLMPSGPGSCTESWSVSPFAVPEMIRRLGIFLEGYSQGEPGLLFELQEVLEAVCRRLDAMVEWISGRFGSDSGSPLASNLTVYSQHRDWIAAVAEGRS